MSERRCTTHHHACTCREQKFSDAKEKLRKIREAMDHCNAQPPVYVVDALYDFRQAVEEILGEK